MTEATAVTDTASAVDTGDMSPSELVAHIAKTKPKAEAAEPAKADDKPAEPTATTEAKVDEPATDEKPAEAKPVEPPKRSALEIAKAAAAESKRWRAEQAKSNQALYAMQQELKAEKERASALAKQLEGVDGDELEWLEKRGVPADVLAKRALEAGTPEALAARKEKEIMARIEAAEKRAEAAEKAARDYEERQQQQAKDAGERQARADFVQKASDATKYPALARLAAHRPDFLIQEALNANQRYYQETGQSADHDRLREYLEKIHAPLFAPSHPTTGTAQSQAASPANAEKTVGTGAPEKPAASTPRTLTNGLQDAASLPTDWDDLSDAEQKRRIAADMKKKRRAV